MRGDCGRDFSVAVTLVTVRRSDTHQPPIRCKRALSIDKGDLRGGISVGSVRLKTVYFLHIPVQQLSRQTKLSQKEMTECDAFFGTH